MKEVDDTPTEEEALGDFVVRVWREAREELGFAQTFMNWCIQHHFEIVREFVEFDEMMSGE